MSTNWPGIVARLRWATTCLVFFGLPFVLLAYGLGTIWDIQCSEARENLFSQLDEYLLTIRKFDDPVAFFDDFCKRVTKTIKGLDRKNQRGKARKYLKLLAWNLETRFPGVFKVTLVNENGEPDPRYSPSGAPKLIVKKLVGIIREMQTGNNLQDIRLLRKAIWPLVRGYIGPTAEEGQLDGYRGRLSEVHTDSTNRWFAYFVSQTSGLLAHLSQTPDWDLIPAKDRIRRIRRRVSTPGFKTGLVVLDETRQRSGSLSLALGQYERALNSHQEIDGRLFSISPYATRARVWVSLPSSFVPSFTAHRLVLTVLGSFFFSLLTLFSYRWMVLDSEFRFSIRYRLILLFGFAAGLPLLVLGFYGWDYLHQKFKARVREAHDIAESNLQTLDGKFPLLRGTLQHACREVARSVEGMYLTRQAPDMNWLARVSKKIRNSEFLLVDVKGKVLSSSDSKKALPEENNQLRKVMGLVARSVLKQMDKEGGQPLSSSEMLVTAMPGVDLIISPLLKGLGQITPVSFGIFHVWVYFLPIRGPTGHINYLFSSTWDKFNLEQFFLETHLTSANRHRSQMKFFAFHALEERLTPEWKNPPARLMSFMSDLRRRQGTTTGTFTWKGRHYLMTGIKPKEIGQFFLMAIESAEPIEQEIRELRRSLSIFTVLAIGFSLFLGLALSQQFLTPLASLNRGVTAIQERQFRHRVPSLGNHELGDLAQTFNRVMEGLSDLEVARIVQESLFPPTGLQVGPYRVSGCSVCATELGGDYYDMQKLSDNRLLILIGDVSGHGVPAALVMAMAKALVEHECASTVIPSPDQLLLGLHQVLFRTLKRKRTMTCFLGILDVHTHLLTYANAGHNYPFLFRPGEPARNLTLPSFPLGSRQNITIKVLTETLRAGDHLLFYTDGFVEAQTEGDSIGYQRVAEEIPALFADDPAVSLEAILAWHRRLAGTAPQADDITLVVLSYPV